MRELYARIRRVSIAGQLAIALCCADAHAATLVHFDLPAQPLARSLKAIGAATNTDVGFDSKRVEGLQAPALKADLTLDEALMRVLAGTGLRPRHLNERAVVITLLQSSKSEPPQDNKAPLMVASALAVQNSGSGEIANGAVQDQAESKEKQEALTEIIVTGSHIRGEAPVGSQLKVYTREDLDQSGAATVDQFARLIPQNFSNTDPISNRSSNSFLAAFSGTNQNIANSAAFNLRGLGPSATLTLVNGHRLAPAGADGSIVDVSQIPLSAIDHIDVLSDGASAIYGSDAVAGVVNIVTRKDFDGAESSLRYGEATAGGAKEVTASQLLGKSWSGGNALLTYEYDDQGGLDASQRSYIGSMGGPFSLLPENRRNSVFLTGSQDLAAETVLSAQALYSERTTAYPSTVTATDSIDRNDYSADERQSGLTLSIDRALTRDWHLSLSADFSDVRQTWNQNQSFLTIAPGATPQLSSQRLDSDSQLLGMDALVGGSLIELPGGAIKVALGGDFRREQFGESDFSLGFNSGSPKEHRNVSSVFAESAVPLFGPSNALPALKRLDLSGAVRYDNYSDVGASTNFKLGAAWEPLSGLTFRSTLGTSFQAPFLSQIYSPQASYTFPFADPASATGVTDTLYQLGGNTHLAPEKSRALTAGFDLQPAVLPQLRLSANYFRIGFNERIEAPPVDNASTILSTPLLTPFVLRNPPLAQVLADFNSPTFLGDFAGLGPAGVGAIFDDRIANIAATSESGIDFGGAYRIPVQAGALGLSLDVTRLLRNDIQTVSGVPAVVLLNAFGQPTKWKGRGALSWTEGSFTATAFVNYVSAYDNTLFMPAQSIGAWTTGDLYFAYKGGALTTGLLHNLTLALNINNVTDKRPPFVSIPPVDLAAGANFLPFDAANASPVGRVITLQVTKGWGGQ